MKAMMAEPHNAKSADAHNVYGMWLAELGKFDEAKQQAKETLKICPSHSGTPYLLAQAEEANQNMRQPRRSSGRA